MNLAEWIRRAGQQGLLVFAVVSFLAIALGALVMAQADIPLSIWIRNPIAWLVAGGVSVLLARRGWLGAAMTPVALIVVSLSLAGPGQQGVHRWLDLGPVQLNAAALVLPAAIATFNRASVAISVPCLALIAVILAWQPDISQLVGLALAAIILATARIGLRGAAISSLAAAVAFAICLSRPDPLDPVPHVESIFGLGWSQSPGLAIVMGASLGIAALSPLLVRPALPARTGIPLALAAYLSATALAPLFGAYPVPLAGYGLSFVIGWWLGFAALSVAPRQVNSLTSA